MNTEIETLGEQLAREAVEHVLEHAQSFCGRERERISAANEPKIIFLESELAALSEAEVALKERIHRAPPVGDIRTRRRKARYYWAITGLLAVVRGDVLGEQVKAVSAVSFRTARQSPSPRRTFTRKP